MSILTEGIIVAFITIVGNILVSAISHRKTAALVEYRLQELEKKVAKHNTLVERTYKIEQDIAVLQNEVAELK